MNILSVILLIYIQQMMLCCIINVIKEEKEPENFLKFLESTFLPTVIWKLYNKERN